MSFIGIEEPVTQSPDKLLIFSMISRGFLTVCFCAVVTISPNLLLAILRVQDIPKHLRICYAVNILNSLCYVFTFGMNQPNLLMPSPFALFRGVLRNRFGAVSLAISFANLISGVIVTILVRLFIEYPFTKGQRFLLGTLPYAIFHLTAILPALIYIVQTMNFMDEQHLSHENLTIFVGRELLFRSGSVYYFPRTAFSAVYSLIQVGSFAIGIVVGIIVAAKQFRRQEKFALHTVFHILAGIVTILAPWSVVFGVIYLKPIYGMEVVTCAFIVTFFYPLLEIACIVQYVGSVKRLTNQETG